MKTLKVFGLGVCIFLTASLSFGQTLITNNPTNVPPYLNLRSGTFSNRTQDGFNLNNGATKTWTFFDQTSWNSQFYNGDITKPAYTEGHMVQYSSYDFQMNYRLLFPVGYNLPQNANYKYPLILFVHGAGERGNCWGAGNSLYNTTSTSASGNITSGTTTLTRTSGTSFSTADRGKNIRITGSGSLVFTSYITSVINSNQVTIAHTAPFTASGNGYTFGWGRVASGTGSINSGSSTFTSNVATFNSNDVGAVINIGNSFDPCAVSFGAAEIRITSVISSTQVTLSSAATATLSNVNFRYGVGTNPAYRSNDLNLVHAGNEHLQAVYTANGKLAEDPTLPTRGFPGFVVVPQSDDGTYYNYGNFQAIVDLLVAQYNIDPDRIYIHGLSNGGQGTWNIVRNRPELFAAALPMSATIPASDPIFTSEVAKAVPIPTWIFQGGTDGNPTVNNTNQIVDKLRAAGASVRYKIYPTVGHGTWGYAYAEPDFFSWMLKQNKRNITILYGDSTLCPTDASGVKLALGTGFKAYQWELDGVIMSSIPLTSSTVTVTQPGTYRARFSRVSANPTASEWNAWSKPVVIRETSATAPVIVATGTSHLPDVKGGNTTVRINGPTKKDLTKNWYVNGSLSTTNPLVVNAGSPPNNLDSANYTIRNTTGVVTLKTIPLDGCSSVFSNSIYVTASTPSTMVAPVNPTATATTPNSVQLFWTDNTPDETGFEIYRSTTGANGSFNFFRLVNAGTISFTDTGLTPATTYYYSIRAVNNTTVSPYTNNLVVTTPGDTQPPTVPQNVVVGLKTLTSISLSWTASTDNTGIQQYQISYTGPTSGTVNTVTPATSFNVIGLVGNSNYFFIVKAIDLAGNSSQASNQLAATTIFTGLNYAYSGVNVDLLTDAGNNWNTPEITGVCSNFDITLRKQDDYFNFRFDGYISLPAGDYQFRSQSDDGSMVFIGAEGDSDFPFDPGNPITPSNFSINRVFDNDGLHGCGPGSNTPSTINFSGTAARPITVIMFEKTGGECLTVEYIRVGGGSPSTWTTIPSNVLFSGTPPVLTPPPAPIGLSAAATGMSSINLNWSPTSFAAAPYPANLKVVVLGSSTAVGTGASSLANSWVGKLTSWLSTNMPGSSVTNLALGGFTTQDVRATGSTPTPDVTRNITMALSLNPSIIIVNLPSNDIANGIPINTTIGYYNELKAAADLQGVPILITTTQPRNFNTGDTALRQLLQDEAVSIRTTFGNQVIDIYDYLTDFANDKRIKSTFDSGDGFHLNDSGHDYIYNKALDKLLQQYKKYEVYRSTDNVNYSIASTTGINPFADSNLLPSTLYYYKMKATTSGGSSGFSSTVSATTQGDTQAPTVPTGVTILTSSYTNVGIQWTASTDNVAVVGYRIYANGILLGTSTTTTYSSTALLPATFYAITVRAYDASGNESVDSAPANLTTSGPLTFFCKASGGLDQLSTWGTNPDGSGTAPISFSYDGQLFKIPSPQNRTLTNALTIGGNVSRVIVDNGATLTVSQPLTGTINVGSGSTLNVNVDYQPVFETIDPTSTINFNTYSSVPVATYGNLTLNGSGTKNIAAGTLEVVGNLTLANGVGLKGAASNGTTVKVNKDFITGSSVATVSSDNRVTLLFSGSSPQNMTVSADQAFYKISATANASVSFNNTSGSPKTLTLGSTNGGGLDLATGSTLVLGSNHLTLTDNAVVNPTNTNGKISISNANISLTTSASSSSSSNFYFANSPNNQVQNFTLQASGGSLTTIRSGVEVYNALKINSGTLNASGNVTLKSSATASASIPQIVAGSITGNVNVERYMSPKRVYRYLASPVAGLRVADLQTYVPVTGSFTGNNNATVGSSNSSMFHYTTTGWVQYPVANNTETLTAGRGYAVFVRNGSSATTLMSTGVPNQGTIAFTTLGERDGSGYSLLGNPYASDVVWNNTGWSSSNINNTISVRENNFDGNGNARVLYWDRSLNSGAGGGTLPNGKIPAGQAFWVQASSGSPSLSITEAAKTTDNASSNTNFFRSGDSPSISLFSLRLSNGSLDDVAFVNLTDDGNDQYDKVRDGAKRPNSFFNLSTVSADGVNLAINDASNNFCDKTIAINLQPGENQTSLAPGSYSIEFQNLDNFSLATLQLIDSFTGTTTTVNGANPTYSFSVTADAASYQNRLTVRLTRPTIATNNLITTDKEIFCKSDNSIALSIHNSQPGVIYRAINSNGVALSNKEVGDGETIQLVIPVVGLGINTNTIKVSSSFAGCASLLLSNSKTISISDLPSLTVPEFTGACLGSTLDLTATGNGKSYEWKNEVSGEILTEKGNTLRISIINSESSYQVSAISADGCRSNPKNVLVKADTLSVPSITFEQGLLKTNATTNLQWYIDGTAISGAIGSTIAPDLSGHYTIQAKNTFCTRISAPYLVTAIEDQNSPENFILSVYPNPSETGYVKVKGSSVTKDDLTLQVIDILGKDILNMPVSINSFEEGLDINHKLPAGVYIVKVIQNNKAVLQRLIIH